MNYREGSTKSLIIKYLDGKGWEFEGVICRWVHSQNGQKEGIISRRCREMRMDGILVARYVKILPSGLLEVVDATHGVVQYCIPELKAYDVYRDRVSALSRVAVYGK